MLSTATVTTSTSTVRIKSLDTQLCSTEQKDLELESEELPNNQPAEESEEEETEEPELPSYTGISERATEIKDYLCESTQVKAVLLKQDGTSEEISYDTTSVGTRKLLSGRPSVIGEIEDLQVVALRSLKGGDQNQHTLPVPLCNTKSQGDLVLFRVDSSGKPSDITLQEYQKYATDHKALTASAVKNYSADGEQIQSNSPFDSTSKVSMKSLAGALETEIVMMAEEDKSAAEIEKEVMEGLQQLVDEAVASLSLSPMDDPDYNPEEETLDEGADLEVVGNGFGIEEVEEEISYDAQLADALDHVRKLGRADGALFAEKVCSTFFELNGAEPSLDKLTDLYDRIKKDFANEAQEQSEEEEEEQEEASETESEAEEEIESEESLEIADDWEGTLDHIRDIAKKDGAALAENACDLFYDINGDEPTLEELTQLWQIIQDELAAEAEEDIDSEYSSESEEEEEVEEVEEVYDPENDADQKLAQKDAAEDKKHEVENFDQVVLNTPMVTAKNGGAVSWNMYFNEGDLNEEAESSKLVKTLEGFKMMNQREPTPLELRKMKMFLSVPNDLVDEEDVMTSEVESSKTGSGASWNVYYDDTQSGSLQNAVKSFVQFHQRQPSSSELNQIRSFLSLETSEPSQVEDSTENKPKYPSKVLVSPMTEKKAAKRFNVYLEDSKLSQQETEEIAVKWFERFNKRKPSEEDLEQIRSFVAKDADLTAQEFMIPVKAQLNFEIDDDVKEEEPSAKSVTKQMVTKKAATGYTLNFEDDEKREEGDEQEATKWFKRFNNREPSDGEKQQIKQFVKGDEEMEEMVDIE